MSSFITLRLKKSWIRLGVIAAGILALLLTIHACHDFPKPTSSALLTDPFLQLPTSASVQVVWFTDFQGREHWVDYGEALEHRAIAKTFQLSRVREDQKSRVGAQTDDGQVFSAPTPRQIWRHEATVSGLASGVRVPYRAVSQPEEGSAVRSDRFTLSSLPPKETPLKILLTSDHQLMPMTAANMQRVKETIGQVDAVFLAGDLVNIPDRASEWFDDNRGGAFFPCLQGRAAYVLDKENTKTTYRGGALIQQAPLFPAVGNHEVMGRVSDEYDLNAQFADPYPKQAAAQRYLQQHGGMNSLSGDGTWQNWLKDNSFNTDTFEEIFTLPTSSPGGERYYALTFGDVRLIVLYAANIWRSPSLEPDVQSRYRERDGDITTPEKWGYGQHIFEPIERDSPQYRWLQQELSSPEFQQAKFRVVMFHYPMHSLGDNIVPAYTNPIQIIEADANRQIQAVRYEYPLEQDYLIRDVQPLLERAGVQLVFYGHSHLWNRFIGATGTHYLESSNVGNTYGAYLAENRRPVPIGFRETYRPIGDPNGLKPIVPTIAPLVDQAGHPQPYIASNDSSVFSILDTQRGTVSSYRFDPYQPDLPVIKFDEFQLRSPK